MLKDNNVYWAVDDFGTGINNMSAVERYKPNIVKLDRGLIADVHKSESKQRECRKWINTFHEREILALAEGVETEDEYKCLVELGFDLFQGFYLGRPE